MHPPPPRHCCNKKETTMPNFIDRVPPDIHEAARIIANSPTDTS